MNNIEHAYNNVKCLVETDFSLLLFARRGYRFYVLNTPIYHSSLSFFFCFTFITVDSKSIPNSNNSDFIRTNFTSQTAYLGRKLFPSIKFDSFHSIFYSLGKIQKKIQGSILSFQHKEISHFISILELSQGEEWH